MILKLGIYEGDIVDIPFNNIEDLISYMQELSRFDCVWLITNRGNNAEMLISEKLGKLIDAVTLGYFGSFQEIEIHEYESYEAAYDVALMMRSGNPKAIEKQH